MTDYPLGIPPSTQQLDTILQYNPTGRKGAAKKLLPVIEEEMLKHGKVNGKDYLIVFSSPDDNVTMQQSARIAEMGYKKVIIGGGDGMQHICLNGLLMAQVSKYPAICPWPMGTACDVSQSLGIKYTPRKVRKKHVAAWVNTYATGKETPMDLLEIDGRVWSADAISFGLEPDVLQHRVKNKDNYPWPFNKPFIDYLPSIAKKWPQLHKGKILPQMGTKATISVEGEEGLLTFRKTVYSASVQNTPVYAGHFRFPADYQDGEGDLILVTNPADFAGEIATQGIKKLVGLLDVKGLAVKGIDALIKNCYHVRGREFHFEFDREVPLQIDGEPAGKIQDCTIKSYKAKVNMIVNQ